MKNKLYRTFLIKIIILIILANPTFADIPIYELFGTKIIYDNEKNVIVAEGSATAIEKTGKKIFADKILYDKKESIIYTFSKSIYLDEKGNKIQANEFVYDLNLKIIKAKKNVRFTDNIGNKLDFSELDYNAISETGVGKNFRGNLIDKSNFEGNFAEFDNKIGVLKIGEPKKSIGFFQKISSIFSGQTNYYTPCENKDKNETSIKDRCPDWSVKTEKTIYDRKDQVIKHYGAIVKIKDIPVFYTPYFSHPDPSVKRKSGILPPSLKKFTDLGQTIKIPYFYVIDETRDITFTPIYYFNENPLFLAEYRQQNENGKLYFDTSFTQGYKNLNKTDSNGNLINRTNGSRNHFFFNFLGNYDNLFFKKNDLEINLQRVSQKNYLNINQINTDNIKQEVTNLNNNFILNSYQDNKKITIRADIFENLSIDDRNTKYQYNIPTIDFNNFLNKFNQNINFTNKFVAQNLGGDSNKIYQTNKVETVSNSKQFAILESVTNLFKTSINNINKYNDNISNEKNNFNSDLNLTAAIESALPLIRLSPNSTEIITPKIFTKYTTGSMNNATNENKILTTTDVFSMNRMSNDTNPETGASLGYGIEYEKNVKDNNNYIKTKNTFFIGQVLRPEKLNQMPSNSTLSDTRSAYVGKISLDQILDNNIKDKSKKNFKINYEYIISNNFNQILKNSINSDINLNDHSLSLNYYKTHQISNDHFIDLKYLKKIDDKFSYTLGGKKNIKQNFTENNYIGANYETDCIKISLNMSKTFFQNEELKPSKNLTLSIMLKPFGSPVSPNLSSFLN